MSGSTLPTVMTPAGLQAQTPVALNAQIIAEATALAPGLTILPGALIEDIASTDTGAAIVMDQARVDVINSITPLGANPFLLYQLGAQTGIAPGQQTNASVDVVFTASAPGVVIPIGFTVSDGSNQYAIVNGGVTGSANQTQPLLAVATNSGTFAIPAGTVTQLVTSAPTGVSLTVTNPFNGTPAQAAQTISAYRGQVLQAGFVTSIGTEPFLKTLLAQVPGVNPNLISVRIISGVGTEVIVGGSGDPYLIAGAILQSGVTLSLLVGSTLGVSNFTAANPGVVTTTLNHGFTSGQVIAIAGVTPSAYNGSYTITVIDEKTFSVGVNTSSFGAFGSGGVITPNFRNQSITLNFYPDSYTIPFVLPPSQTVAMAVSWNTNSLNFVSATAVASLASAALANYINGLPIGAPINTNVMNSVFQTAVASILQAALISVLSFSVSINGVATSPESGTELIFGDPESSMTTTAAAIVVEQT